MTIGVWTDAQRAPASGSWAPRPLWLGGLLGAGVLSAALMPHNPLPMLVAGQDKLEHFAAFAVLTLATCWGRRSSLLTALALLGGAVALELAQALLTASRTPSAADALASMLGVGVALAALAGRSGAVRENEVARGANLLIKG